MNPEVGQAGDAGRSSNGVQLAIMNSRMNGIVTRMTNTLLRSARSGC